MSQGCAVASPIAMRHPESVSHLVLYGGFQGKAPARSPRTSSRPMRFSTLMRQGWGKENPLSGKSSLRCSFPTAPPSKCNGSTICSAKPPRRKTPCACAALRRYRHFPHAVAGERSDAGDALPQRCVQPFEEGRRLAAGIPGARFVALEGRNHVILEGDPAWDKFASSSCVPGDMTAATCDPGNIARLQSERSRNVIAATRYFSKPSS